MLKCGLLSNSSAMRLLTCDRWMGTYPELPSYVLATGEDLQHVLDKYPDELIGKSVAEKFNHTKLPFLPKVLSIAKALPLQLHPVRQPHACQPHF